MKRRAIRRWAAGTVLALASLGAGSAAAATPAAPAGTTAVVQPASTPPAPQAASSTRVTRAVASRTTGGGDVADLLQTLVDDGALSAAERDAIAADVARAGDDEGLPDGTGGERLFDLATAADLLGTDVATLRRELSADGATLAGVAAAHGVDARDLVAGLTASAAEHIDVAVAHDLIDAEEAADRRAELAAVVADAVQAEYVDPARPGSADDAT